VQRWSWVALLLCCPLIGACSDDSSSDEGSVFPDDLPSLSVAEAGPPAEDRLAIIDDGELVVMAPDGSDRVVIAGDDDLAISQPTWSPDGRRLAWAERTTDLRAELSLVTANVDGSGLQRVFTPFAPFYAQWDPTGRRIGLLGAGPDGPTLGIADFDSASPGTTVLDSGQPYFFSWSDDGERLLAHAGSAVAVVGLDGSDETIAPSGLFQAPIWVGDDRLVYAVDDDEQAVVITNVAQSFERRFGYSNGAWLVMSPSGTHLAVQVSGPLQGTGAQESAQQSPVVPVAAEDPEPGMLPTGLHVVDLVSGGTTMLSDEVKVAFFWSPDGERLLVLDLESGDDGTASTRWEVWTGQEVRRGPLFSPSLQTLQEYLPFFDQYAQSISFWSPSGDRFVYAGTDAEGEAGIWVASADDPAHPELVSTGTIAVWSPT
jgi:TolB protein